MYNAECYIQRCLDSCFRQQIDDLDCEVIIVDDGSNDFSAAVVSEISKLHSNIRYFYQENQGQGMARNFGLAKAEGNYIFFVDADDYLLPNSILQVLNLAEANSADIVRFQMEEEQSDGTVVLCPYCEDFLDKSFKGEDVLFFLPDIGSVCTAVYSKRFLHEHLFEFRTDIKHEDVAFNYEVYPEAKLFMFSNVCCYHYCYNIGSTDRTCDKEKLRLLMFSNVCIALELKRKSKESKWSKDMRTLFLKKSNSMQVSAFLQVLKCDYYPLKEYVLDLKKLCLLPIIGQTQSLRTTLLIPFVNIVCRLV